MVSSCLGVLLLPFSVSVGRAKLVAGPIGVSIAPSLVAGRRNFGRFLLVSRVLCIRLRYCQYRPSLSNLFGHFLVWWKGNIDALYEIKTFRDLDYNVIMLHWQPKHIIFDFDGTLIDSAPCSLPLN